MGGRVVRIVGDDEESSEEGEQRFRGCAGRGAARDGDMGEWRRGCTSPCWHDLHRWLLRAGSNQLC